MRIAISVPDELFALADDFAKQHGLSRSKLYVTALRKYIEAHRHDDLTERINRACETVKALQEFRGRHGSFLEEAQRFCPDQ